MPRRLYASEVEIDAPPEEVWAVLCDLASYPDWNPFTVEVVGSLEPGATVDMKVRMVALGVSVRQREIVRAVDPPERIVWGMRSLFGMVRAERRQTLTRLSEERTRYTTVDVIEGPLAPLVHRIFGSSIQAGFDGVARELARRVEALRSGR